MRLPRPLDEFTLLNATESAFVGGPLHASIKALGFKSDFDVGHLRFAFLSSFLLCPLLMDKWIS